MYTKEKPDTIQHLFDSIAPAYDRGNAVLSFGLYRRWNRALVHALSGDHLLDLCAGTGDIAFAYLKSHPSAHATLLDFSPEMLKIAERKGTGSFKTVVGDAQDLPFPNDSFDSVSIAYGIRNIHNPKKCFTEVYRVLKPGGTFGILELTRPTHPFLRLGHRLYLRTLLPLLGRLVAGNGPAYSYLSSSIASFSSPPELKNLLVNSGFSSPLSTPLQGGIATLLLAKK